MNLWEIILAVGASLGGTTACILIIVKWASKLLTEKIQKDYDLKLTERLESYKAEIDKDLEQHRSALGNKNYITQKKFDAEFEMYRDLANAYYRLVKEAVSLIPAGYTMEPADKKVRDEMYDKVYEDLRKEIFTAQDLLFRYAPFIQKEIYDGYYEILNLCNQNMFAYARRWNKGDFRSREDKEAFTDKDYKRSNEINQKYDAVNSKIREYLQSLEVLK